MNDELSEHRVPVTVFTTVRAVDYADASRVAEVAVRQALSNERLAALPLEIRFVSRDHDVPVQVHHISETGIAAGNGYLWVEPTSRAYREGA
jgi:hypothetical protein